MKWERIAPRFREHAHKLRQALAGALELHTRSNWDRATVEEVGLRDFAHVFGRPISSKTFWRVLDRTLERDRGAREFKRIELYLPGNYTSRKKRKDVRESLSHLPTLANSVLAVADVNCPTATELQLIWVAACEEWQTLTAAGSAEKRAAKIVLAGLEASGIDLARSSRALRVAFKRKLDRWTAGNHSVKSIKDLRTERSGNRRQVALSEEDRNLLVARALTGGLSRAWREAWAKDELSPALRQMYTGTKASKSYVPRRIRDLIAPDVARLERIHHGPRQAALNGAWIPRDWSGIAPGDWYQADDTTLPLYYWEEDGQGGYSILRGQCLLMIDCRVLRILSFALHSERNYTAKVIRGLILKTHDDYGLPREGFYFENGTWRSSKLLKGANDEIPSEDTELGLREWVRFIHAKPGNARAKVVERVIGIMQDRMEDQPGYCGRNELIEKFERLQVSMRDARAERRHPSEFLLHRDEWCDRLAALCEAYNDEAQDGKMLNGLSPRQAWDRWSNASRPLTRLNGEMRYLLSNHRRPLKIGRNGICVEIGKERHYFRSEDTGRLIGSTVQVYFDPEDLSSVFMMHADRAVVVPAAPVIPAIGATREEMHAAQVSVDAHNRPARTLYRAIASHFPENGPTPFRPVLVDQESLERSREIAAQKEAIRGVRTEEQQTRRVIDRQRRARGSVPMQDAVSIERQNLGYKLLEEADQDANT